MLTYISITKVVGRQSSFRDVIFHNDYPPATSLSLAFCYWMLYICIYKEEILHVLYMHYRLFSAMFAYFELLTDIYIYIHIYIFCSTSLYNVCFFTTIFHWLTKNCSFYQKPIGLHLLIQQNAFYLLVSLTIIIENLHIYCLIFSLILVLSCHK